MSPSDSSPRRGTGGRNATTGPRSSGQVVPLTLSRGELERLLALSDERDRHLALRLDAWRQAYQLGRADGYDAGWRGGFAAAVGGYKAAQQEAVRDLGVYLRRWGGLRRDFGKPRPGDYPGRQP